MNLVGWVLVLILGKVAGWPILAVWWLVGQIWHEPMESKLAQLLGMGLLLDLAVGTSFGIGSLLLWLISLEMTIYKEKVGLSATWPLAMWAILVTAQASLFWQSQPSLWVYIWAIPGCLLVSRWFGRSKITGGGKGIYLRGQVNV